MEQKDQEFAKWEEAEEEDDNMLVKLERPRLQREFFDYLESHTTEIKGLVAQQLSLRQHQQCIVADRSEWLHGDFNACVPVTVSNWRAQKLLVRCPFPYMFKGLRGSDNVDEKIRCEAATFAWVERNCSQVPIPRLRGFGLPSGLSVSRESRRRNYRLLLFSSHLLSTRLWFYEPLNTSSKFGLGFGESHDVFLLFPATHNFH